MTVDKPDHPEKLITVYQTMQSAFTLNHKFGIKTYTKDIFEDTIIKATTETIIKGPNHEFHKLFWFDPKEEHSIKTDGAPQVILNGPFIDACSSIPRLVAFEFTEGKHNWGEEVVHPNKQQVDWPITHVHNANTMGEGGVAEGGWMKSSFCNSFGEAKECEEIYGQKLCNIL